MTVHTVALADDHNLIRSGLASLINSFEHFEVIIQAGNGEELISEVREGKIPSIVLLDIQMPRKDGYETAMYLKTHYPQVRILALSMSEKETAIIRMLKCGARGYILKDADPADLRRALKDVIEKGFYFSELVTGHLLNAVSRPAGLDQENLSAHINLRELEFLKYCCTEYTYKEIAERMFLSPRTIDGYRDALFDRLHVKTRIGLAMYAIKNGIVNLVEH